MLLLRGKAFNALENYDADAKATLQKAVKRDPNSIDAWNCLGECYYKKKSFTQAKQCFERALSKERNKTTLCGLSMVLRQLGNLGGNFFFF